MIGVRNYIKKIWIITIVSVFTDTLQTYFCNPSITFIWFSLKFTVLKLTSRWQNCILFKLQPTRFKISNEWPWDSIPFTCKCSQWTRVNSIKLWIRERLYNETILALNAISTILRVETCCSLLPPVIHNSSWYKAHYFSLKIWSKCSSILNIKTQFQNFQQRFSGFWGFGSNT